MRPRRSELHTMAGAYVLDALSDTDRARFERHLARCRACAEEQRELRETAAGLAGAVATDPPAEVIERTIAAAAKTRQLPPVAGRGAGRPAARRSIVAWRPGQAVPRRLAAGLAATFLAAAIGSGVVALTAEHRLGAVQRSDHGIAEVLNAPDAVMLTARVRAGGSATVVMSRHDRSLVFTTAGLPSLPAGRCYQLWLMGPRGDRSAAMLPAPHDGMTSPVIATGLAVGDWVGLTVEPASGAVHPTSTPILMLNLTA